MNIALHGQKHLVGGRYYKVGIVTNRKLGLWAEVTLIYCGGSCSTPYGTFGGVWCHPSRDHRSRKPYHNLHIAYITDIPPEQ